MTSRPMTRRPDEPAPMSHSTGKITIEPLILLRNRRLSRRVVVFVVVVVAAMHKTQCAAAVVGIIRIAV